jgi:EAL domain-containing protein (putative c-di-GMP-specific phosphodiesterase class I)/AmiR/NasT family two-component response regulator
MSALEQTQSVLVIDDEPFQLKLLARQFANLGLTDVQTCLHAREALQQVGTDPQRFDVICCDLQMPDMDGIEFVRHLGQSAYRGGVVLISGEDRRILHTAERLAQSHSLNVLGALRKPVAPEQLRELLAAARAPAPSRPAPRTSPQSPAYTGAELERAIGAQELVNHYQPKVDFATGHLVGVEALVRWRHPKDGLVYPDRFIPVAEESGLIDLLTHEVLAGLHGALRQARAWHDQGLALQVSVNVSMDNLNDYGFPEYVAREVAAAGVAPSALILEVTESRMMKDPLAALDILTRLRLRRVSLSIDDFGTGHSSLTQLHEAPFDELKIDRGFVHGAWRNEAQRAILLPSLDMARQLGIKTVAEGVEDADDWHFMRSLGCDLAQGFFIARPMPGDEVAGWAAEWEGRRGGLVA